MALTQEDLALLGKFVTDEIEKKLSAAQSAPQTPEDRASQVGVPDVDPEAGPEFYIHLADGEVVKSHDSSSTHLQSSAGESVQVIGRYQVGG